MKIKSWILALASSLFVLTAHAQEVPEGVSDDQLSAFMEQAASSGMSEAEIKAAALAKGVSVAEMQNMVDRINTMKKGKVADQKKTASERLVELDPKDFNPRVKRDSVVRSKIFGANIFRNNKITFEPNIKIPTPKGYILGPGDEILVDISGYASVHYTAKVSTEGTIKIESLSPIYVNGLTIEQARERVIVRLKTLFAGLSSSGGAISADVTLGSIRSIKVMIIGEAFQPGTYTLPSLATVFNALYACGGPTDKGSFRNIEVYRNGKPFKKLDIYDFLLKGDQRGNFQLNDQDLIRIPYYEAQVEVSGEVLNPMIFEIEKGETLKQVVEFAGGFKASAYQPSINIKRPNKTYEDLTTVFEKDFSSFELKNGDSVMVSKVTEGLYSRVVAQSGVVRPGAYAISSAPTVKKLIEMAGGLVEEAYKPRALIKRAIGKYESKFLAFDLGKLMTGEIEDLVLEREDTLLIRSSHSVRENLLVFVDGAITNPAAYNYVENMTVGDLIITAHGFMEKADPSYIELSRRIKHDATIKDAYQDVELIRLKVDPKLGLSNADANFPLKPFDRIYIYASPKYADQQMVTITGEVMYPGQFAIKNKSERISDLIARAGGLKPDAYLHGARFTRNNRIIGIELENVLNNAADKNNLLLIKGDSLEIPRIKETVTVVGEVLNPTSVGYTGTIKLKPYISAAGGFTDSANVKKVYVRYANGKVEQTRSFSFFKKYPKIENGAEIFVPTKRKKKSSLSTAESISLISGFSTVAALIYTILRSNTGTGN